MTKASDDTVPLQRVLTPSWLIIFWKASASNWTKHKLKDIGNKYSCKHHNWDLNKWVYYAWRATTHEYVCKNWPIIPLYFGNFFFSMRSVLKWTPCIFNRVLTTHMGVVERTLTIPGGGKQTIGRCLWRHYRLFNIILWFVKNCVWIIQN